MITSENKPLRQNLSIFCFIYFFVFIYFLFLFISFHGKIFIYSIFLYFRLMTPLGEFDTTQSTILSIFWIVNHLIWKLGQLINKVMGSTFRKIFAWFERLGRTPRLFWFTCLKYHKLIIFGKFDEFVVFTFLKMYTETIKSSEHYLLKTLYRNEVFH